MMKKIISWSLCLTVGAMMTVSCRQDIEEAGQDLVQEPQIGRKDVDYSVYAADPRAHACRIVTIDGKRSTEPRGAAYTETLWNAGQTVTVSFIGGSNFVRQKVIEYAKKWEEHANITFQFVQNNGMIRVSFVQGAGSYSYFGTDALQIASNTETMNFGWFNDNTPDAEFSRTVLHEFGHALGLIHEHQHPDVTLDWDRDFVYAYYAGAPNYWSAADVDNNLLNTINPAYLTYNQYDINSIMHYQILGRMINSSTDTPINTVLSEGDKQIAGILYPF